MKKVLLIVIASMGVLSSCVEERTRYVIAHRVDGNDTITLQVVRVDKNFQVDEVVFPVNGKFKYKIVRFSRGN
jgi:hypothetical protein